MPLSTKSKQQLKAKAHKLKPTLLIGQQGLTESVIKEAERTIAVHELIKVRISTDDRDLKRALFAELCAALKAELLQVIGNIGVIYRKNPEKK